MFWQAILTGVLLSADAWVAGATYGREGVRTGRLAPFFAAGISAAAFWLTGCCSEAAGNALGETLCRWLGAGVLFILGSHALYRAGCAGRQSESVPQSARRTGERPGRERGLRFLLTLTVEQEHADMDGSKSLSATEGLLLGAAMSLDAASAGLGAPEETLWATGFAVFLSTFAALTVGTRLGKRLPAGGRWLGGASLLIMGMLRLL